MNPTITLATTSCICARHGELFKPRWPTGYPIFTALCWDVVMHLKTFEKEYQHEVPGDSQKEKMMVIEKLLAKKPMCCRIEPRELVEIFREVNKKANVWDAHMCSLCGKAGAGSKYRRIPPNPLSKQPPPWPHVCIGCVCSK